MQIKLLISKLCFVTFFNLLGHLMITGKHATDYSLGHTHQRRCNLYYSKTVFDLNTGMYGWCNICL